VIAPEPVGLNPKELETAKAGMDTAPRIAVAAAADRMDLYMVMFRVPFVAR
jgi:hypothetical protein